MSWIISITCAAVITGVIVLNAILFALWDIRAELRKRNRLS
jgi:hypothetical protein